MIGTILSLAEYLNLIKSLAVKFYTNYRKHPPGNSLFSLEKDVRGLSWMSHGVMHFWFLLNFLFISAFFDILALLSVPRVNMWGTFQSNYKHFSCQSSCLLLLLEVCKNHYRKENVSIGSSEQRRDALFWIHLRQNWLELFRLL